MYNARKETAENPMADMNGILFLYVENEYDMLNIRLILLNCGIDFAYTII